MLRLGLAVWCALILTSCSQPGGGSGKHEYDHGTVTVEGGEQTLIHTFRVQNDSQSTLRVDDIVPSCACVKVGTSDVEIGPRSAIDLEVAIKVSAPGVKRERVVVFFDDGSHREYRVSATGVSAYDLRSVPETALLGAEQSQLEVTLWFVDLEGRTEEAAPSVVGRDDVSWSRFEWTVIEPLDAANQRPLRQLGRGVLEFDTKILDELPCELVLRTGRGVHATIRLAGRRLEL